MRIKLVEWNQTMEASQNGWIAEFGKIGSLLGEYEFFVELRKIDGPLIEDERFAKFAKTGSSLSDKILISWIWKVTFESPLGLLVV